MSQSLQAIAPSLILTGDVFFVPTDRIEPNPFQPRGPITPESLEELASSVLEDGVLQPILVRPHPTRPNWFQLVSGERRWRATMQIGRAQIAAVVREIDDLKSTELALLENLQRESLTDFEEARGLEKLWQSYENAGIPMSKRELARRVSKSVSFVSNRLDSLGYAPEVQELLERHRGVLTVSRSINAIRNQEQRAEYIALVESGAGVRAVQSRIEADQTQKRAIEQTSRAPDAQTQQRAQINAQTGGGNVSRGRVVTGSNLKREARQEIERATRNIEVWAQHLSDPDFENLQAFARRLLRGDLAR